MNAKASFLMSLDARLAGFTPTYQNGLAMLMVLEHIEKYGNGQESNALSLA